VQERWTLLRLRGLPFSATREDVDAWCVLHKVSPAPP
jgi:hypothetical protein